MNAKWKLLDADEHRNVNPDFFVYPSLSMDQRKTVQVGEQLKILTSVEKETGWSTKGIWVVVLEVNDSLNFLGRPIPGYALEFSANRQRPDGSIEFGPENIYRMEPREYTIWGRDSEPMFVWGNGSQPQMADGQPIEGIKPVCVLQANGWNELKAKYAMLASRNSWPTFEDLQSKL